MILGSHTHVPEFFIGETKVELATDSLKILGVTIDDKLTSCEHISNMLKKVYVKIGVLRRLTVRRALPWPPNKLSHLTITCNTSTQTTHSTVFNYNRANFARRGDCQSNSLTLIGV